MSNDEKSRACHIYFQTRQDPASGFEGLREESALEYDGLIYETDSGYFIRYDDSGGKASIRIRNDIITVTNAGNSGNRLVFDQSHDFEQNYAVGQRVMNMRIITERAHIQRDSVTGSSLT